jgi:hypothetical protein
MALTVIRDPQVEEISFSTPLPSSPHTALAALGSVLGSGIAALTALTHTSASAHPTTALGSTEDPTPPSPAPYDPNQDPDDNSDTGASPSWLPTDISDLPIFNPFGFPGDDIISCYLRFLEDMKDYPGSLNMMDAFWNFMTQIASSGKLNDPALQQIFGTGNDPGTTGMTILSMIVMTKAFMWCHTHNGQPLPADFFQNLANQFSGSDPMSRKIHDMILGMSNFDPRKNDSWGKSANQWWGDWVTSNIDNGDQNTWYKHIRHAAFMAIFDALKGKPPFLIFMYIMMMMEMGSDDQISGQGETVKWANGREQLVKDVTDDIAAINKDINTMNDPNATADQKQAAHDDAAAKIKDAQDKLTQLGTSIDGSFLGEQLTSTMDPAISKAQDWLSKANTWIGTTPPDPKSAPDVNDIDSVMNGMNTSMTDMGQTLGAQISQIVNYSKLIQSKSSDISRAYSDMIATMVRNQTS